MDPTADPPAPAIDPAQLPALLQQLVIDLADPAVTYLLGGHYYDRTNHPRSRHFPAVFTLRQGEVAQVEVGPNFVAFNTELVRYPDRGERHYPGPWADRFRATVPFDQLYQQIEHQRRRDFARGMPDPERTPAAVWRAMPYGRWQHRILESKPPTPLRELLAPQLVSPGTGSTWKALAERGLV